MSRELATLESLAVNLIRHYDKACEHKKLVVTLVVNPKTIISLIKHSIRLLKVEDKPQNQKAVTLTTTEYGKYVKSLALEVGFIIQIDGSILTHDGMTLVEDDDN